MTRSDEGLGSSASSVAGRGSPTRQRSHVETHERRNVFRGSGTSGCFRITERAGSMPTLWKVLRTRQRYIEGKAPLASEVLLGRKLHTRRSQILKHRDPIDSPGFPAYER